MIKILILFIWFFVLAFYLKPSIESIPPNIRPHVKNIDKNFNEILEVTEILVQRYMLTIFKNPKEMSQETDTMTESNFDTHLQNISKNVIEILKETSLSTKILIGKLNIEYFRGLYKSLIRRSKASLKELDPSMFCTITGFCNSTKWNRILASAHNFDPKTFVTSVSKPLISQISKEWGKFRNTIKKTEMYEDFSQIDISMEYLSKFYDQYILNFLQTVFETANPKDFCDATGLCDFNTKMVIFRAIMNLDLNPVSMLIKILMSSDDFGDIMRNLEIEEIFQNFCKLLPSQTEESCRTAVSQCYHVAMIFFLPISQSSCIMCETSVRYITDEVCLQEDENKIPDMLQTACSFAGLNDSECQEFQNQHVSKVCTAFNFVTPVSLCYFMQMCPKVDEGPIKMSNGTAIDDSLACDTCNIAVANFKSVLLSDRAVAQAKLLSLRLCEYLPATDKCQSYANNNIAYYYRKYLNKIKPATICENIQICSPDSPNL